MKFLKTVIIGSILLTQSAFADCKAEIAERDRLLSVLEQVGANIRMLKSSLMDLERAERPVKIGLIFIADAAADQDFLFNLMQIRGEMGLAKGSLAERLRSEGLDEFASVVDLLAKDLPTWKRAEAEILQNYLNGADLVYMVGTQLERDAEILASKIDETSYSLEERVKSQFEIAISVGEVQKRISDRGCNQEHP